MKEKVTARLEEHKLIKEKLSLKFRILDGEYENCLFEAKNLDFDNVDDSKKDSRGNYLIDYHLKIHSKKFRGKETELTEISNKIIEDFIQNLFYKVKEIVDEHEKSENVVL